MDAMHRFVLGLIILLALLLRIIGISLHPPGFTPDEASFGYDAYSLLKTAKDQWGEPWPITSRSFGDFKLPLYTYLTIPSVTVFDFNEFAVRLPNALFDTLSILVTYLLANRLFGSTRIGILASLLLAISPRHISLSRGAFEASLTTFFMPLGVFAFLKEVKKPRWILISALVSLLLGKASGFSTQVLEKALYKKVVFYPDSLIARVLIDTNEISSTNE